MKLRAPTAAAVMMASIALIACGNKDGKDGGSGGEVSVNDNAAAIKALQDKIAELEAALMAAEGNTADVEAELTQALMDLQALQTCDNGGACDGVQAATEALTELTDAYCEWVFSCCSNDEARATLGAAAGTVDGCKSLYSDIILRADVSPYAPSLNLGATDIEPEALARLADGIQGRRLAIDGDALTACAEEIGGMECGGALAPNYDACENPAPESACGDFIAGLRKDGESCSFYEGDAGAYQYDECMTGFTCVGGGNDEEGICAKDPIDGSYCQGEEDCESDAGDLYCDEDTGTCKTRAAEGEACQFEDPSFQNRPPTSLVIPCEPGTYCSMQTSTCKAECDKAAQNESCYVSSECADGLYCDNDTASTASITYKGQCAPALAGGTVCNAGSDPCSDECASGSSYSDGVDTKCRHVAGGACAIDGAASADTVCASGSCDTADSNECRADCSDDNDCATGEICSDEVDSGHCYPTVTNTGNCVDDDQCPTGRYCEGGTCTAKITAGNGPCSDSTECADGLGCAAGSLCQPLEGSGESTACTAWYHCSSQRCDGTCKADGIAEGAACKFQASSDINDDQCGPGLFCKPNNPAADPLADSDGVCTAQLAPGARCDRGLPSYTDQCQGNYPCYSNTNLDPSGQTYFCRYIYTTPDEEVSCTLPVPNYSTAYN